MKHFLLTVLTLSISLCASLHAQVGIGTTAPNTSAVLDLTSTSKGFLPPRMSSQQRDLVANPVAGLTIWC